MPRIPPVTTAGLDDTNRRRRHREVTDLMLNFQHDDSRIRTPAEISAGVTPVNYAYPPGNALRYGTNTIPGTTDMTTAIQAAINVAGAGGSRGVAYVPAGAYLISESLVPGAQNTYTQVTLQGEGCATQIINAASAGKPSFNGSGVASWTLKDLLFTGNSSHLNDGVLIDGTTLPNTTLRWAIERVVCMMPGIGFNLKNTNTGRIISCKSWPPGETPIIAPVYTASDISHHILMTGGYVHDVTIQDFEGIILSTYKTGQAGIRCNASNAFTIRVIGGLFQCNDNTRYAFDCSNLGQFAIVGPYVENALIQLDNCQAGVITGLTTGGVGGAMQIVGGSLNNTFTGVQMDSLSVDSTSAYNTFVGCSFGNAFTDSAGPFNRYINCLLASSSTRVTDAGAKKRLRVTQSGGGTKTPDAADVDIYQLQVGDSSAFAIGAPANAFDGKELIISVRNNTGGAIGAITWDAIFRMSAFTNPASGNHRSVTFVYDATSAKWFQTNPAGVDILN